LNVRGQNLREKCVLLDNTPKNITENVMERYEEKVGGFPFKGGKMGSY